jgi:hypothetical protein
VDIGSVVSNKECEMGLHIELKILKTSDDLVFDVANANTELMAQQYGGFGELYCEFEHDADFEGPFKSDADGLKIAARYDDDFSGYGDSTMIWGCYGPDVFETIADNISEGKIVFLIDIEGNSNEYYICEPAKVQMKKESELTFGGNP